ncbi:M1 family metallopeptidase [Adhaeribacter soli]|uniref:Aminopeptidase N n=1 Tax=Adhaeribacter soli TaxID=2607655 RepID=A0A5N1IUU5_9BACT|nr:M1 family metallopeptidase [Adhaeribacter soli]KAA9333790.1 M1 family metallopeptidase [Adhaeribacter soli]
MNLKAFAVISFAVATGMLSGCKTAKPGTNQNNASLGIITAPEKQKTVPEWVPKPAPYQPSRTQLNDIIHTKLRVSFDWQKQHLLGEATLTCKPYFYPQNTLILDAKGFDIKSIELASGKELKYTYDGKKLNITLDKTYTRDQKYEVYINYVAKPNELEAGGSAAITSDKGLYFINPLGEEKDKPRQIWTQGETEASSCWFPTIDSPNEKMTQELYITIEKNFKTLSNGTLIYSKNNANGTRTDYWKMELPHAPYLTMMAIGEFAVVRDTWKNKDIDYYVEPKYKNSAKGIFGNTPEMLTFFSQKLGVEYPWEKYAQVVVRDYVSGAMENTSASVFGEFVQLTNRELLDHSMDEIIAHELFHQWFGDLVTTESWSNLPLNESLATYGEYLWFEHKLGVDEADLALNNDLKSYLREAETKQVPLIRYHYQDKEDMFDRHSYQKGSRVMHMLRKYVGDEAFFASLKKYLVENKFKTVEIHNLRLAFEEVTGEDLNWFFDQWFLQPGHPQLKVSQQYANGKVILNIQQTQDSTFTPIYKLPLKVVVWTNNQKTEHPITITKANQTFELPAAAQPQLVLVDAEAQLLGTLQHEKSPAELIYQYYHAGKAVPRLQALQALTAKTSEPEVQKLLQNALNDKFWLIRSQAVTNYNLTTRRFNNEKEGAKDFSAPEYNPVKQRIREIALKDPKTSVRADAIATLASFKDPAYLPVFEKALQDSSYTVVSAGVDALISQENVQPYQTKLKNLKNTESEEVVAALASFYARHGEGTEYPWFEKQLTRLSGPALTSFLPAFAAYLYKVENPERQNGINAIENLAKTHNAYYVRLAGYQALTLLADEHGVQERLKTIRNNEKDERLQRIYKQMQ